MVRTSQVSISFPTRKKLHLLFGSALLVAGAFEGRATAQTFKVLHNFATAVNGAYPIGALTLSSNVLCGVTGAGGPAGNGAIFKLQSDGTGFTNFYNFSAGTGPFGTNTDGGSPNGGLVLSGNTLYGTALNGGAGGGTVYRINTDGTGFTNLHSFVFSDDEHPNGDLVLLGNTLYGSTTIGGVVYANAGTVFAVNTDGTGYTTCTCSPSAVITPSPIATQGRKSFTR